MTDKEPIIIDGVDVSECKCLHNVEVILEIAKPEDFEILCGATNGAIKCEKWKDCYYKQLALKTQECEALKSESFTREELITIQEKDIARYRKALEEIELTIKNLEKGDILTFPDFTLQENATMIINQCNQGYRDILDIINKAKGR